MSDTITLSNVSLRFVGVFCRINQPFTAVPTGKFGFPFSFNYETLTVKQPSTVENVMKAVQNRLSDDDYTLEFSNIIKNNVDTGALDRVSFGKTGGQMLTLSSHDLSVKLNSGVPESEPQLVAPWQYYVFKKGEFNEDGRVEVAGRAVYGESPIILSDMRIIWRLLITYRGSEPENTLKTAVA